MDRLEWGVLIVVGGLAILTILVFGNTPIGGVVWNVIAGLGG